MDLLCTRRVDPVRQSPRAEMYGYFTHGTDPPFRPYSLPSSLFPTAFAGCLPRPNSVAGRPVTRLSPRLEYYTTVRLLSPLCSPFRSRLSVTLLQCSPKTLPVLLRPRAVRESRLQIQRPSSGRRRDFNPPEQCAAQRTLYPRPTCCQRLRYSRKDKVCHGFRSRMLPRYASGQRANAQSWKLCRCTGFAINVT